MRQMMAPFMQQMMAPFMQQMLHPMTFAQEPKIEYMPQQPQRLLALLPPPLPPQPQDAAEPQAPREADGQPALGDAAGDVVSKIEKELKQKLAQRSQRRQAEKEEPPAKVIKQDLVEEPPAKVMKKHEPPAKVMKKPTSHKPASSRGFVPRGPDPVHYLGGKIYDTSKMLRIYRRPGDRIDKQISYRDSAGRASAYQKAYEMIDSAIAMEQ